MSREKIEHVTLSPGGEVGLLKRSTGPDGATLLEHLPEDAIVLFCDPDALDEAAAQKVMEIPPGDRFHVEWTPLLHRLEERGLVRVDLHELDEGEEALVLELASLEAFRPMEGRVADPQIVDAQRREFFAQLHRWRRQDQTVLVLCNNAGEQQRLEELWAEYGFEAEGGKLDIALGTLSRGFLYSPGRWVVVSDAEVFGRYKVQRPRRMKGRHGAAMKSAFDINFTDLEAGDYVVHLQHGIGRYLGMKAMPLSGAKEGGPTVGTSALMEYATSDPHNPPPKLYAPVSEALWRKYIGQAIDPAQHLGGNVEKKGKG